MRAPCLDRVLGVEAHRRRDGIPEPFDVGLAEDGLGPAGIRRGHDDPVQLPAHHEGQVDHPDVARLRLRDELGVEPVEERRFRVAGERDQGRPGVAPGADPVEEVLRRPSELGLGAELDRGLAQMEVGDDGVHARRARPERRARDGTGDRRVLDQVDENDLLARLDVRADPDDEVGEPVEALVGRHRARRSAGSTAGRAGATRPSRSRASGPRGRRRARRPRPSRPRPATEEADSARGRPRPRASPRGGPAPPT